MGSTELLSTGATSIPLYDQNRIAIQYQNSTRLYAMRLADTFVEPLGTQPYTAPNAYEGRRMKHVVAPNGTQWLYLLRAGTSEFFRYGIEHI